MSKQTESNLFIVSSGLGFYQQLLSGIRTYEELANRLLSEIKAAHSFRQKDRVRELSTMLLQVPIKEYQLIAQYYLAWCGCRELKLHTGVLETVIEQSQTYKARGLVARAAHEALRGNTEPMMYLYTEALKASPNISEYVDIVKAISAVKSVEGFHKSALRDLERLLPIIKHAEPFVYYDFLNSYAVELLENGRSDEASNVSNIVVSSPFAPHYPEWQQTHSEVIQQARKDRSTVFLSPARKLSNVVQLVPKDTPSVKTIGKVLPFPEEEGETLNVEEIVARINRMSEAEKLAVILKMVLREKINDIEMSLILVTLYGKDKTEPFP
jgi:hypothetical protein